MQKRQMKKRSPAGERWDRRQMGWMVFGILLAVGVAFSPSIQNDFVNWDDPGYVTNNYTIRDLSLPNLQRMFTTQFEGNYHPLTMLSIAIEYQFAGLNPTSYHVTNLVLHLANTAAVFWFILLLSGRPMIAVVASLLFGIHPMHVESVAWVSERKDVLHTLFYLGALIAYVKASDSPGKKRKYLAAAFVLFVLSLLSKAMAVTLPVVFLLVDYYRERRITSYAIREKIPFFATAVLFGVIAVIAQQAKGAIQEIALFPFYERILFANHSLLAYVYKLAVPTHLSAFYPYPLKTGGQLPWVYYPAPLVVGVLAFLIYRTARTTRVFVFSALFFLVTILLVLQLYPVGSAVMADRYTYLPSIGLFFLAGHGYVRLSRTGMGSPRMREILPLAAGIIVLWMGYLTYERCKIWKDNVTLWTDVIEKYQIIPAAYTNRALSYSSAGNYEMAIADLNKALELMPHHVEANVNRGNIYFHQGKNELAIRDYNRALEANPASEIAYNSRGAANYNLGKIDVALADFNKALQLKSDYPEAYMNRGNAHSVLGDFAGAVRDYDVYLRYDPVNANVYYWRGLAKAGMGRHADAIRDYSEALRLSPNIPAVFHDRSRAYQAQGMYAQALADVQRAQALGFQVDPGYADELTRQAAETSR